MQEKFVDEIFHVAFASKLFTFNSSKDILIKLNAQAILDTRLVFRS